VVTSMYNRNFRGMIKSNISCLYQLKNKYESEQIDIDMEKLTDF
jgi:hypothetical protein